VRQALLFAVSCALFMSVASGCGYGKISAAETARQLHDATTSRRVHCSPGRGDYAAWDYACKVYWVHPDRILGSTSTLGANVNSTGITFQTAP
jgi:hypothetical protein